MKQIIIQELLIQKPIVWMKVVFKKCFQVVIVHPAFVATATTPMLATMLRYHTTPLPKEGLAAGGLGGVPTRTLPQLRNHAFVATAPLPYPPFPYTYPTLGWVWAAQRGGEKGWCGRYDRCGRVGIDYIKSFYLDKEKNIDDKTIILLIFKDIIEKGFENYTFYVHNLSNFDFVFIINALVGNGYKVNPILNDNNEFVSLNIVCDIKNIKNLKINRKVIGNRIVINIKDSYLLLGSSLRSLCKVFNTKVKKGIFPYGFVNDKNLN